MNEKVVMEFPNCGHLLGLPGWTPATAKDNAQNTLNVVRSNFLILMYFVLPFWLLAGFAGWLCHRASHIETTAGAKESLIHLLMFAEVGVPLLAAMFLEVNALIIAAMIVTFFIHEATARCDVSYGIEQHLHSFLEMIPLMAIPYVVSIRWDQFLALYGVGLEREVRSHLEIGTIARRIYRLGFGGDSALRVLALCRGVPAGAARHAGQLVPPAARKAGSDARRKPTRNDLTARSM